MSYINSSSTQLSQQGSSLYGTLIGSTITTGYAIPPTPPVIKPPVFKTPMQKAIYDVLRENHVPNPTGLAQAISDEITRVGLGEAFDTDIGV